MHSGHRAHARVSRFSPDSTRVGRGRVLPAGLAALCLSLSLALAAPSIASAEIAWSPCPRTNDFACAHLTVPLKPAGGGTETITLAMRRHLAPTGRAKEAVIALAGGPGQAAIPFLETFTQLLGPILSTRDLVVFDQRGIGLSHPLSCSAFEHIDASELTPHAVEVCANQIGPQRGFYETADTVADIEAIRQAAGYERLVLYGTSYGTKVAERYAQHYPTHVSAMVLDSVVLPNGPEPLSHDSFAAVPRVLRGLCAGHACTHVTRNPVSDLARLVQIVHHHSISGRAVNSHGRVRHVHITAEDLLGVLFAGDFNPLLRSEYPGAVRSALEGDTAALARMLARAEGSEQKESSEEQSLNEGFDTPLYFATSCEEQAFPFNRSASPATRRAEALAALRARPASEFAPFTPADALAVSNIGVCANWPFVNQTPEIDEAPLPAVPTLIFSGEQDLRTPTADARALAAEIPGAKLVIAHTGHSVLTSPFGDCARSALQAFFAHKIIKPCDSRASLNPFPVVPVAPRKLAGIAPAAGTHGPIGRALHAVQLTLADFNRSTGLDLLSQATGVPGLKLLLSLLEVRIGGLRAGWAELSGGDLSLHDYTYVPGVSVSGALKPGHGTLRIGGGPDVRGVLRVTKHSTLVGVLGGVPVSGSQRIALI
jgi:pimeloyl-ACP methyl ester carboxylesterase